MLPSHLPVGVARNRRGRPSSPPGRGLLLPQVQGGLGVVAHRCLLKKRYVFQLFSEGNTSVFLFSFPTHLVVVEPAVPVSLALDLKALLRGRSTLLLLANLQVDFAHNKRKGGKTV